MLDGQVMAVRGSKKGINFHEAIIEWLAWRNDQLPMYRCVGDMPLDTAVGYQYLASTYGKRDLVPHKDSHNDMVAEQMARIRRASGM